MKRLAILCVLVAAVAQPAMSFDPVRRRGMRRVTLLQAPLYNGGEYERRIAARVRQQLVRELRSRGFDAVDARISYDDLRRGERHRADLFVEIAPADIYATPAAAVGASVAHTSIDIGVVVSHVAAELRVYDGRTLDQLTRREIARESTSIAPSAVGVGTYRMSIWFALPFSDYLRYRAAINAVVEAAADEIATVAR